MSWYILAAINVCSISVGTLFQKLSMRKEESNPVASAIVFQFLLGSSTLVFALINGYHFPPLWLLPFFLLSGALYAIGTVSYFHAYKYIGASEVSILGGAGVIMTIIASFIFLHDQLTFFQLFGVFLILAAIVTVNITRKKMKLNTGAWLALVGTGTYGLAVVSDSYIIRHYDAVSFLPLACFMPGIIILLFHLKQTPSLVRAARHIDRNLIIFTGFYTIQAITFYLSLQSGALVSQISTISRASIILTVILATLFLNERKHVWRKVTAAILTTIGVLLVS